MPADSVSSQDMAKEASDIPQFVGLISVDGVVVFGEGLLEKVCP